MGKYQVAIIERPQGWQPHAPDDVPPQPGPQLEVAAETDDLFEAVGQAIAHNENPGSLPSARWAVVVEPGSTGRIWPQARLCTPIAYQVAAIWWPEGWEPGAPLDVPNCVFQAAQRGGECEQRPDPLVEHGQALTYDQALVTVNGLNRQCIDTPGTTWYVVVAVENELLSQTISYDRAGIETTVDVHRLHVIRPERGGRGDCSHCPAHEFACARDEWTSLPQTVSSSRSRRPIGGT